jgi:hypothetical protein
MEYITILSMIRKASHELRARLSRRDFFRNTGRCATCPWVKGASFGPAVDTMPYQWPCRDHRQAFFTEQVVTKSGRGGSDLYINSVDYCARYEVATATGVIERSAPQLLTWRQIGRRLLHYAGEALRPRPLAEGSLAAPNVAVYESFAVGALDSSPEQPDSPRPPKE